MKGIYTATITSLNGSSGKLDFLYLSFLCAFMRVINIFAPDLPHFASSLKCHRLSQKFFLFLIKLVKSTVYSSSIFQILVPYRSNIERAMLCFALRYSKTNCNLAKKNMLISGRVVQGIL